MAELTKAMITKLTAVLDGNAVNYAGEIHLDGPKGFQGKAVISNPTVVIDAAGVLRLTGTVGIIPRQTNEE